MHVEPTLNNELLAVAVISYNTGCSFKQAMDDPRYSAYCMMLQDLESLTD